jgi:UDPglucose--hexose-1-phosphate uridylyltransferase
MINTYIKQLVEYGVANELIEEADKIYTTNIILEMLKLDDYEEPATAPEIKTPEDLEAVLKGILDYAVEKGLIEEDSVVLRDLFDTKIMNALVPKPSQVIRTFWEKYKESPEAATEYYYKLSCASD